MAKKTGWVYCLLNPRTKKVFYIGQTKYPYERYYHHIINSVKSGKPLYAYMRDLIHKKIVPKMIIIKYTDDCYGDESKEIASRKSLFNYNKEEGDCDNKLLKSQIKFIKKEVIKINKQAKESRLHWLESMKSK